MDDRIILALIGYCREHVGSMGHWQNSVGLTCDETGCAICNASSTDRAAWDWQAQWLAGEAELPFDLDDDDRIAELHELAT